MKNSTDFFSNLLKQCVQPPVVHSSEIPDIDLYMDQVTTFIEDKLKGYRRNESDKLLTKTMINNYTKNNLLPRPHKKKYSKQHIMSLIFIFYLKQILSIQDIKELFSLEKDAELFEEKEDLEVIYNTYIEIMDSISPMVEELLEKQYQTVEMILNKKQLDTDHNLIFLFVLSLISQADTHKLLAQRLIDEFTYDSEPHSKEKKKS